MAMKKRSEKAEFKVRDYSQQLLNAYEFSYDKHRTFRIYKPPSGLWINDAETFVEKFLRKNYFLEDHRGCSYVKEVIADLKSLCFKDDEFPKPDWSLIPFNNGVYNLHTGEFSDFKPDYHFISKLSVAYNSEIKDCPVIKKIFRELVTPEKLSDLYELAAYCMVSTYANQEIYFLYGPGRNGKSVYTYIITQLLGKDNISAASLHDLQTNRFAGAELYGKYANISAELRYGDLNNTDQIKKLTGGDRIQAERKFQHPFSFVNYAKLIFVTNELPKTDDKTQAFYRRVRVISFPNIFEGKTEDKLLWEKITAQELEGLAFRCIPILRNMIQKGFTFTNQKQTADIEQEYEELSNPIATFIQQECITGDEKEFFITKDKFKNRIDGWLRSTHKRIRKDKEIAQYMKEKGISEEKKNIEEVGRKNCWVGIKCKE